MATTLKAVQGNTAPAYDITCQRDDGSIIDLTNTTPTLQLYRGTTQTNVGHESCTIVNATSGIISWLPRTGDFSAPGTFKGNVKVTYQDGTFEILYGQVKFKIRKP